MDRLLSVVALVVLCLSAASSQGEPPPELKVAKEQYTSAVAQAKEAMLKVFMTKEAEAAENPRLKVEERIKNADQIEAERKAFTESGALPTAPEMKLAAAEYQRKVGEARKACERVFDAAAGQVAAKDRETAKAILAEKDEFLGMTTASAADQWTPLFNGRDRRNWQPTPGSTTTWTVERGMLVGKGSGRVGTLYYSKSEYADFRVRVAAVAGKRRRVMFRCGAVPNNTHLQGYTISLDPTDNDLGTLSVFVPGVGFRTLAVAEKTAIKAGAVVKLDITARDNVFVVAVDGKEVVNFTEPNKTFAKGFLAVQCGRNDSIAVKSFEMLQDQPSPK